MQLKSGGNKGLKHRKTGFRIGSGREELKILIEKKELDLLRKLCIPHTVFRTLRPDAGFSPDWKNITMYALRQGLAPMIWYRLQKNALPEKGWHTPHAGGGDISAAFSIHPHLLRILRDSYLRTLRQYFQIMQVLGELDRALQGRNILCMVWKGAALADMYPAPGLRPMDDIDLLILPKDRELFADLLRELGFAPLPHYPSLWRRGTIILDVHEDVLHSDRIAGRKKAFSLTAADLAKDRRRMKAFAHLSTPSPDDALICLAVHAMKHGFSREICILDALCLMNRYPEILSPREDFIRRIPEAGALLLLFISLIRTWLGADCREYRGRGLLRLVQQSGARGRPLPHMGEVMIFLMTDSFRDRLAFLLESLFPSPETMRQIFPEGHSLLFTYPRRFLRLAKMARDFSKALLSHP